MLVLVFRDGEGNRFPVGAAGTHDGEFGAKGDPFFKNAPRRSKSFPDFGGIRPGFEFDLALAIIAEVRRFEHRGGSDFLERLGKAVGGIDHAEGRARKTMRVKECLLAFSVLANVQHLTARMHRTNLGNRLNRGTRDVFKLKGNHIHPVSEFFQCGGIGVGSIDLEIADLTRWAIGLGLVGMDAVAHAARSDGQHAAELTSPKNADDSAREDGFRFRLGFFLSRLKIHHGRTIGLHFCMVDCVFDPLPAPLCVFSFRASDRSFDVAYPARLPAARKGKSDDCVCK